MTVSRKASVALMKESYLVQRLEKPRNWGRGPFLDNPFSFGGGLRNGGLSDEAMGLLRVVFSFDYMGAAEFEFGAVPDALLRLSKQDLTAFAFAIPLSDVAPNWRDKDKDATPEGEATVYVLCPAAFAADVEERIRYWAHEPFPRLKEGTKLPSALRPVEEWDRDVCGWLELDNGFFFFTDPDMWTRTCFLFGVEGSAPGTGASKGGN